MKKKTFSRINRITLAALLAGTITAPFANLNVKAATVDSTVNLRFMETTDLHDAVMDYDYYQDAPTIDYGLDRTAKLIQQARGEVANSMLFDAGDLLQGNPMADYVAKVQGLGATEVHPMFKAMGLLNYDAGIVGNHEFNYGLPFLNNALEEAPYDVVNANIYKVDPTKDPANYENYFTPYQILDKQVVDNAGNTQTIKVGVIGFAPPQIMQWDKDNLTGKVVVKDIVQTANKFIPEMKAKGADIIVAIAHSGCDITADGQQDAENAVYSLSKVQGIDALMFGHAHLNFPGDKSFNNLTGIDNTNGHLNGVPAMEAGFWGNNLGVMDLQLQKADGKWTVTNSQAALRPLTKNIQDPAYPTDPKKTIKVSTIDGPDQAIVDAVAAYHQGTLNYVRGKIGETTAPMSSYFSRVMDDPTIQIVNNAQTDYVKNWISTNRPDLANIPVISAGAPFKAGRQGPSDYTNIAKGDLSIKSANDLYLYNNTLKAVELTGAQVKEWLEMSAAQFNQISPTKTDAQELIDYSFQPYNFDVIDGVKYQVDVTQPARYNYTTGDVINANAHRIINFTDMNGNPIDPAQKFIVATNNYRASGGGNFPGTKGGNATIVVDSPYENRQILMDYIKAKNVVNPVADNNWKLAPVNGQVKLVFRSSPSAKNVLGYTPNIQDVGTQDVGGVTWEQYQLDQTVHVQILGINDLHGQLDYKTNVSGKPVGGIEYLAGYLKEREATNPSNTLMVQAGDAVGASRPVSALLQDEPTIRFLNELGFDVGTIGNHEFDEGVTEMKRLIYGGANPKTADYNQNKPFEGASFPYVVANVVDENTNQLILPPYVVKEVDGVKIGFIGVVTTETPSIVTPSGVAGVKFTDEVEAINKYTAELKTKGVKAIVVLAHDPGTSAADGSNPTGKVVDMARAIDPEVDVIYGAHDHRYLNSTVNGKLLVQSYSYGTAFSDVDLTIDPITQDIVTKKAEVASTFQNPEHLDAKVKAELDAYQAYVAPITSAVIGQAATVISRTTNPAGESPMGNLIADGMKWATGAQFAFMNVGGVRDEIKKTGDITWGDLFAIQPFGNDVVTEKITGEQVRILLNQQFAADRNRIMQIAGLKYTWSDNFPLGQKVLDIYLPNGSKIDPNATYTVAVNNFMADGGDGFVVLKQGTERVTRMTDIDALIDYIKHFNGTPITAQIEGRITLDNVAPAAPIVNTIAEKANVVTGTTEAGAKVDVSVNGQVIGTGFAGSDGKFAIAISPLVVGTLVDVKATDAALNTSVTRAIVMDVSGPAAPTVDKVTDKSTSVTGSTESGAKVEVSANGQVLGTATAGLDGKFAVTIAAQKAGTVLTVSVTDIAGNKGGTTGITVGDTTAPEAPTLNPVTDASTKVTGTAEAGSKVEVKVNGSVAGRTTADENGNFTVDISKLKAGTTVTATATDVSGNKSAEASVVVKDVTKPNAPVVGKLVSPAKFVTGTAEAGTIVRVYKRHTLIGQATVNSKGVFTVKLKAAYTTGNELKFTATDAAGNVSKTLTVKVVKK